MWHCSTATDTRPFNGSSIVSMLLCVWYSQEQSGVGLSVHVQTDREGMAEGVPAGQVKIWETLQL